MPLELIPKSILSREAETKACFSRMERGSYRLGARVNVPVMVGGSCGAI